MGCCEKKKNNDGNLIEKDNNNEDNNRDSNVPKKLSYNDFILVKLLGRGSFGQVLLVRLKKNNQLYAMKILNKNYIKIKKQEQNTKTERNLMVQMDCPFIVNIKFAFQDSQKLYIISEFLQGGDMFFHMNSGVKKTLKFQRIKFYAVELVLAIDYLHKNKMIYRDLKPENILLDSDGHVKLTDFGLSKVLENENDKTFTICGTPQYLAPEVILQKGYDTSIDWWSLGCVLYQMLTGKIPFTIEKGMKLNMNIYKKEIKYPEDIDENFKDLLQKLLMINPEERIGNGFEGGNEIKGHSFFEDVEWDKAWEREITPPFIPKLNSDTDLRYFDPLFTKENIEDIHKNHNKDYNNKEPEEENTIDDYSGFTYVSESISKQILEI